MRWPRSEKNRSGVELLGKLAKKNCFEMLGLSFDREIEWAEVANVCLPTEFVFLFSSIDSHSMLHLSIVATFLIVCAFEQYKCADKYPNGTHKNLLCVNKLNKVKPKRTNDEEKNMEIFGFCIVDERAKCWIDCWVRDGNIYELVHKMSPNKKRHGISSRGTVVFL